MNAPDRTLGIRREILAVAFAAEAHVAARKPPRTNSQRADEGKLLADFFGALTGLTGEDEDRERVTDAISQLLHYAYRDGLGVQTACEAAMFNFECEQQEDPA